MPRKVIPEVYFKITLQAQKKKTKKIFYEKKIENSNDGAFTSVFCMKMLKVD